MDNNQEYTTIKDKIYLLFYKGFWHLKSHYDAIEVNTEYFENVKKYNSVVFIKYNQKSMSIRYN